MIREQLLGFIFTFEIHPSLAAPKHSGRVIQGFLLPVDLPKWPESSTEGRVFEKLCSYYTVIPYSSRYYYFFLYCQKIRKYRVMITHMKITVVKFLVSRRKGP